MLKQIKPKNARAKRAVDKKSPHEHENTKMTLFVKGQTSSNICNLAMADLASLKRPFAQKFQKKNDIHPFEDASSLEFFSEKNDTSLLVFSLHQKKRPNCLTFIRTFDYKLLDMLEMYIDAETFRTLNQFKNKKCSVGLKPLISFHGTVFESPTQTKYTLAKSLLLDFFRGQEASTVDVEGLQYLISIAASEESDEQPAPQIHLRVYLMKTKRSGQKMPRVEVEEMGPRIDFRLGRERFADENLWKEAMRKPKGTEARSKKNVEVDIMGDKVGKIHVGKQDLGQLQTRKMKGLKRSWGEADRDDETLLDDEEDDEAPSPKKGRV